jgi:putative cardiolipin synthase
MSMRVRVSIAEGRPARLARSVWFTAVVAAAALAAPAAARGDVVRLLRTDQEAAQARVDLIQLAQAEIDASYFAVGDDQLAMAMLALLRDASRRGVRVRLIVDGLNNDIPGPVQRHLEAEGVEIREYHPVQATHLLWINRRLHDKVLVADKCNLIVGSRNLDYRHFGLACQNYVDSDAFVRGCAAREASSYFECLWRSDEVRPARPPRRLTKSGGADEPCGCRLPDYSQLPPCAALDKALCDLQLRGMVRCDAAIDWAEGLCDAHPTRFLADDDEHVGKHSRISREILELFAGAQESIILESPYLVFSKHLDDALAAAQSRGVQVVILTNSLASTDQTLVYAGYANQKKRLLARGIEFWEYAGPKHFHAKTALIDGRISVIGSYNFDPRSEHLNTETAVLTCDPCVADALVDSMAEHFENAWEIGRDGRPIGADERHPGSGARRVMQLRAARLVAPLIKRHL